VFVRPLTDDERWQLEAGCRSSDTFVLRRCQILLASSRGQWAPEIARNLGCDDQTVRNAIAAFNKFGLVCLTKGSSVPHTTYPALGAEQIAQLQALLHQSPRNFGKPTSLWTLGLVASVSFDQGITASRVSGETIRATLARLGIRWRRARQWITSPDPEYARKKAPATA
jgi:transposase